MAKISGNRDTVIVGNGPAALILSYILHGHIPYYVRRHHDPILDSKLSQRPNLLDLSPDLYAHFLSSLRYSTQALPVNTLLDTLLRPNADTEVNPESCIEWRYEPEKAISHVAIGQTAEAGGQWADNPVTASADIATLSYAEQLSLPGYSYEDHLARNGKQEQYEFVRPSRAELADYFKAYPDAVGISDSVYSGTKAENIYRTDDGFVIGSLDIRCKHLVLASGIFTVNIPPTPLLAPIAELDAQNEPLLVIGSGFSAADVIISTPPTRKIIHIFQWAPENRPSPLRGCHQSAYPEYATVYRQMKLAALASGKNSGARSPLLRRKSNPFFSQRDWATVYEGLPNAEVVSVSQPEGTGTATVTLRLSSGVETTRTVGGLSYVVGRRGTLDYLSPSLQSEVLGPNSSYLSSTSLSLSSPPSTPTTTPLISGHTLRPKAEAALEVAKHVFIIGSLAGDSLIRHAVGGCVFTAGRILGHIPPTFPSSSSSSPSSAASTRSCSRSSSPVPSIIHDDPCSEFLGHSSSSTTPAPSMPVTPAIPVGVNMSLPNGSLNGGHADLHLDRRKLARAVEVAGLENRVWCDSGWWGGGPVGGKVRFGFGEV